jgi:hypothetical protein
MHTVKYEIYLTEGYKGHYIKVKRFNTGTKLGMFLQWPAVLPKITIYKI